jgi:hypothetical protein
LKSDVRINEAPSNAGLDTPVKTDNIIPCLRRYKREGLVGAFRKEGEWNDGEGKFEEA